MTETGVDLTYEGKAKLEVRKALLWFLVMIICFGIYRIFFKKEPAMKGIYTIARFITLNDQNVEIPEMQYQLGLNVYTGKLTKDALEKIKDSKQFIIILIDGDPMKPVIISQLPDCLKGKVIPFEGWKELPKCN